MLMIQFVYDLELIIVIVLWSMIEYSILTPNNWMYKILISGIYKLYIKQKYHRYIITKIA